MAFFRKAGNILGRTFSNRISQEISAANPSIFQAIRFMSSSKLFIGGVSYSTDDKSLQEAFGKYGDVVDARIIVDRDTGRSRGFGFVTYSSVEEASAAVQAMDQQELQGRRIRVDYANDRTRGYSGGGGYGGFSGNYSGGGGGYSGGGYSRGGGGGGYDTSSNFDSGVGNYGSGEGGGNPSYGNAENVGVRPTEGFSGTGPLEGSFRDEDGDNFADRRG